MNYDNERDRNNPGFDCGVIIDGVVVFDPDKNEYVMVDEESIGFSIQDMLKNLDGKRVRLTCISFESIKVMEDMMIKNG